MACQKGAMRHFEVANAPRMAHAPQVGHPWCRRCTVADIEWPVGEESLSHEAVTIISGLLSRDQHARAASQGEEGVGLHVFTFSIKTSLNALYYCFSNVALVRTLSCVQCT